MTRRAAKVDDNQAEIVDALRAAGASVLLLHAVGAGCPDILVGHWKNGVAGLYKRNLLMEVKTPTGKLTPDQVEWHATWRGQVAIVRSAEEALRLIGR